MTIINVHPPFHLFTLETEMLTDTPQLYAKQMKEDAKKILDRVAAIATEKGVTCHTVAAEHDHPYEAIISTAKRHHCDLIAMASHGRSGLSAVVLGSETQKVLTHSTIPVIVYR